MGRYFGLKNLTKNHRVSSYWKNDEWCDLYAVMHKFKWDLTDKIYSASYCDFYEFEYSKVANSMFAKDKYDYDFGKEDLDTELRLNFIFEKNQGSNHIPEWDGDICKKCNYKFDNESLKPSTNFDGTFHMN